jgi:hypothetical protein
MKLLSETTQKPQKSNKNIKLRRKETFIDRNVKKTDENRRLTSGGTYVKV